MAQTILGAHGVRPSVPRMDTNLARTGRPFEVVSDFEPAGDQPAAIPELPTRPGDGNPDLVLPGATGSRHRGPAVSRTSVVWTRGRTVVAGHD